MPMPHTRFALSIALFLVASHANAMQRGDSVIAIVGMIVTKSPALAIAAILLTGLAFAAIFPTIVGVTFAKFEPGLYGSIFGIIFAVGLLGGTFVPKFIGDISAGGSVQNGLLILAIMAGILFLLSLFIGRVGKPAKTE